MKKITIFLCLITMMSFHVLTVQSQTDYDKNWPQWRGPLANGIAVHGNPPAKWDENSNIRWKIEIPGNGHATPIIWQDKLFVQTAIKAEEVVKGQEQQDNNQQNRGRRRRMPRIKPTHNMEFTVMAINRQNGKVIWQKTARKEFPHEGAHGTGSWASSSGVTDGKHFYAFFGSRGLYCYDMDGNLQWEKDLGDMKIRSSFGEGSSPVLSNGRIIITWDHEEQSFITALNKNNGTEVWKAERDELSTWATPFIVKHDGKNQVIVSGKNRIRSYDEDSGTLIWECGGLTSNPIPSPVYGDGIVYLMTGHRGFALLAIRLADAKGDITDSKAIVWKYDKDTPYVPSPLLINNKLYFLKRNDETLSCLNAKTGEIHFGPQNLDGIDGVYASPVAVGGRIYLAGRNGTTVVIKESSELQILAVNVLEEKFDASPAIAGNQMYLRGHSHLYCISSD